MGKFSVAGIVITIVLFFTLFGFILVRIEIANPYTGIEQSILDYILDWINPFSFF